MTRTLPLRQRIRKALIISLFLLFPITMNYLSPYVIIDGASQGIVNGSLVMFGLMFISSLFVGRLWCGWACPAGGLGEICFAINDRPVTNKKLDWGKWLVWVPWIGIIAAMAISAGGYHAFDFFLDTQNGISVAGSPDRPILIAYIIYYAVVATFRGALGHRRPARRMPHHLLDGALYDHRAQDQQLAAPARTAPGIEPGGLHPL